MTRFGLDAGAVVSLRGNPERTLSYSKRGELALQRVACWRRAMVVEVAGGPNRINFTLCSGLAILSCSG